MSYVSYKHAWDNSYLESQLVAPCKPLLVDAHEGMRFERLIGATSMPVKWLEKLPDRWYMV